MAFFHHIFSLKCSPNRSGEEKMPNNFLRETKKNKKRERETTEEKKEQRVFFFFFFGGGGVESGRERESFCRIKLFRFLGFR